VKVHINIDGGTLRQVALALGVRRQDARKTQFHLSGLARAAAEDLGIRLGLGGDSSKGRRDSHERREGSKARLKPHGGDK
jgi:hypothetical protein